MQKNVIKSSPITLIVSLSLVLFMLAFGGWILMNFKVLGKTFKEKFEMHIYFKDNASVADIEKMRSQLNADPFARLVTFKPKEEALAEMVKETGEDFVAFAGINPLPNTINLNLKVDYANVDSIKWIEKEITSNRIVNEVVYQKPLMEELGRNEIIFGLATTILVSLMLIIAITLINNTIRLSIYSKRFLLRTMYLVGATPAFIRKPFILKALQHGIIAGIIAVSMLALSIWSISNFVVPDLLALQNPNWLLILCGIILLIGMLISVLSSMLAVRKYLRLKTEDLYI